MPEAIAEGLELQEPWMEFYMNAFYECSTERREPGLPIPWTAVSVYAERYDLDGEDFDTFLRVIRDMDRHSLSKAKAENRVNSRGKPKGLR